MRARPCGDVLVLIGSVQDGMAVTPYWERSAAGVIGRLRKDFVACSWEKAIRW